MKTIKITLIVFAVAFAITSAILIGNRLSTEAMAVLAGAVCGVGAAIPTSLLIIAVTQRMRQAEPKPSQPQFTPPIVMMAPPMQIQQPAPAPPPALWGDAPIQRRFTVVGDLPETEEEKQ